MKMNYGFLKSKIAEVYGTQADFARALGISTQALSSKLNNKQHFSHEQIYKSTVLLRLNSTDIERCFFFAQ